MNVKENKDGSYDYSKVDPGLSDRDSFLQKARSNTRASSKRQ